MSLRNSLLFCSRVALAIALCVCASAVRASSWRTAGDVKSFKQEIEGATVTLTSGAVARITIVAPDVVRVRIAPKGQFERDHSYAVERVYPALSTAVTRELNHAIEISVRQGVRILVNRSPFFITVYDPDGRIVVEDDRARPVSFDPDTGAIEVSKRRPETELYYGFGEKALPMSRHGQHMVMWNTDTYAYPVGLDPIYQSIPFFIALYQGRTYGVFLDNTYRTYFDMGKTSPDRYIFGAMGGELNYYIFTGGAQRTPKGVLQEYTELTGRTPLPPLWALGNQQSRWSYFPESRVREIARTFREKRIPADVIYLDIDYMDGYRVFTWNNERFPDPRELIGDLLADGFRTVLIVDPGIKVDENYFVYRQGRDGGHFHKTAKSEEFQARVWPGVCAFPDFTRAATREWFGSLYQKHLEESVSGFWNDMNEPATFLPDDLQEPRIFHHPGKTFPLDVRHDGDGIPGDHARYHNVYGMQMARATFEGLRRLKPDARPFVLTRAGFAGVQRYSAVWTGDNIASWDHLALTIPMLTNLGVSGIAFVGADVGGFVGSPSGELYSRWLQAAALTPMLRSHTEAGSKDQEPWSYGPAHEKINRAAIELRYQFLPYIYSLFREHETTGEPVMRPLWYEYPEDVRTYLIEDQYMVGSDLLVAPVVREGATKRHVYLPKGDSWVDWWTGIRYEGGTEIETDAPLDRLPLFARAGAALPTQQVIQNTGEMARLPLTISVVAGGRRSASFYEDAGDGYDNAKGQSRTTTVAQSDQLFRISTSGGYSGARRLRVEVLGVDKAPKEVRAGGASIKSSFDPSTRRLRFDLPQQAIVEVNIVW